MGATLLQRPAALARVVAALAAELPVPVTVKLRSGWSQSEVNAIELGRAVESAGAAAVTLHARTREQRYTKAADWNLIGELAASLSIPVLGNGDLLTHYEVRWRRQQSGCAGVMLGRGALIKPWLFREIEEQRAFEPTALQRVALYHRLTGYFREHFGDDDRGRERAMRFLPWHFGFFCRYRPLPESRWAEAAARHPLMQTRWSDDDAEVPLLEAVLRDPRPTMHEHIARALWEAASDAHAAERLEALGRELPPEPGPADEVAVAHG
jgi:tRNA-dihydrouridine synthase 3